ncbi:hypothetical protein MJG53_013436 [Ovis ammon polii x Ovis aries]|uniref:Uncharacterized protein n=1 Tax=Ovis ammon polii x Ovis aries TaxID=2918886 RepID=A0ACB9UJ30_9CETA|nr:hypothetical protein MJG53_013436 [Ovis ammon polii x Ovis aries]
MVTPPPRLVVGTYDSSNASDSEFSDFETSRNKADKGRKGAGRGRKVRKMPVSYLGSKFLGSDLESEDDEELVEAFLRRGEKKPSVPPPRRRVNLPVPMFDDSPGPQQSKADRSSRSISWIASPRLSSEVFRIPLPDVDGRPAQSLFCPSVSTCSLWFRFRDLDDGTF